MRSLLFGVLVFAAGCDATCDTACGKLADCGQIDNSGVSADECEEVCIGQEDLYAEIWEDEELEERLKSNRNCIRDSTCDEIADGECYDEELYAW